MIQRACESVIPRFVRGAGVIGAALFVVGCAKTPEAEPTTVFDLANSHPRDTSHPTTPRSVTRVDCVTPGERAIRGVVKREVRFGAPNYGETPKIDRRDTIAVLILSVPLTLCRDSSEHDPSVRTRRVSLRAVPHEILQHVGEPMTVYGKIGEGAFAFEYGPLVMWVDSIPFLHQRKRTRSTAIYWPLQSHGISE